MSKFRNVAFTSYLPAIEPDKVKSTYGVFGYETCPKTGRKHLQGYIEFKSAVSRKTAQERIGDDKCHIENRKGTAKEASDYCKKDGNFVEWGIISKPGERTDIQLIKDKVLAGGSIQDMLYDDTINNFQQMRFAEGLLKYKKPQMNEPPKCYFYHGESGSGKTKHVYDIERLEDIYRVEPGHEWFDGYCGQEAVLFDEFRGNIPLKIFLELTDRYPIRVKCKGGFVNWCPKRIYFTSCKDPYECYKNCGESYYQITRRFETGEIRHFTKVN